MINSISDAIFFAKAYSMSDMNLSNIFMKALIHRILPITSDVKHEINSSQDRDQYPLQSSSSSQLFSVMSLIPCEYLQIVLEDTCDYLLIVMNDLFHRLL